MSQNIILNAFLDTRDVEAKLARIEKVGGTATSKVMTSLGSTITSDLRRRTKEMAAGIREIDTGTYNAKRTGLFGSKESMKLMDSGMKQLMSDQKVLQGLIGDTQKAYQRMQQNALKGRSKGFKEAFARGGITEVETRRFQGEKGFTGAPLGNLKKATAGLQNINEVASSFATATNEATKLQQVITGGFKPLTNLFNKLGVQGNSLGEIFGTLAGKVSTWLIATTGVFMVIGLVKSYVSEMKRLQDSQIELRKSLSGTREEMDASVKTTMAFAKSMNILAGARYSDTIDALSNVAKAGFEFSDALKIAEASLLAINITELENTDTATNYFIATIRQFNLTATDSLSILNQWNELSKKTGSLVPGIAESVIRSGKAWAAVGGSMAQLNAVSATTIEQTGESGEKIGTMLKTLSARYADLGRAQSLQTLLAKQGIDIYDETTGKFINIFKVMGKLSEKWKDLTDAQKAEIAKSAAGIRQWSRFLGVVTNFDRTMRALAITINSSNSAIDENKQRVNSLDFALRQLSGSWSALASGKTSVVLLKTMTLAVNTLASSLEGLTSIGGIAAVAITAFGLSMVGTLAKITSGFRNLELLSGGIALLQARFLTLAGVMGIVSKAVAAMGRVVMATLTLISAHPVIAAIIAVGLLTAAFVMHTKKMKQNQADQEMVIRASINGMLDLKENAVELAETWQKTTNVSTKKEIGDMFKTADPALWAIVQRLNQVQKGSKEWKDILAQVDKRSTFLASIPNQINEITKKLMINVGWWDKLLLRQGQMSSQNAVTQFAGTQVGGYLAQFDEKTANEKLSGLKFIVEDLSQATIDSSAKDVKALEKVLATYNDLNAIMGLNLKTTAEKAKIVPAIKSVVSTIAYTTDMEQENPDDSEERDKKNSEELLKIWERYHEEKFKIAQKEYEKTQKLNEDMVSSFTGVFTDLKFEGDFSKRFTDSFTALGESIYGNAIDSINESLVKTFSGPAPRNMAQEMQDRLMAGGDKVKEKIIEGLIEGGSTLEQTLEKWRLKLQALFDKNIKDAGGKPSSMSSVITKEAKATVANLTKIVSKPDSGTNVGNKLAVVAGTVTAGTLIDTNAPVLVSPEEVALKNKMGVKIEKTKTPPIFSMIDNLSVKTDTLGGTGPQLNFEKKSGGFWDWTKRLLKKGKELAIKGLAFLKKSVSLEPNIFGGPSVSYANVPATKFDTGMMKLLKLPAFKPTKLKVFSNNIAENFANKNYGFSSLPSTVSTSSTSSGIIPDLLSNIKKTDVAKETKKTVETLQTDAAKTAKEIQDEIDKNNANLASMAGQFVQGMGLGNVGAGMIGKNPDMGSAIGGGVGAIAGQAIGNAILPGIGGAIGGFLGGLFGGTLGGTDKDKEDDRKETVKLQRESTKELKMVNRNLVSVIEKMDPYAMSESYYFAVSNNRGLMT